MLLSFSFDGIKKDFIIAERGKRRTAFAPIRRNFLNVPGMAGAYLQSTETDVRVIQQPIIINGIDRFNVRKLEEELSSWLVTDEPKELIFDDEADRVYYAVVDGEVSIEDLVRFGRGEITFVCPDPYKYKGQAETEFFYTNPTNLINEGTVETFPIFRANLLEPVTNIDLIKGDEYMRVGQPYEVIDVPKEAETLIFEDDLAALTGWSQASYVDNGHISGEIEIWDGQSFTPRLFGQVIENGVWQGPSLKKTLPEKVQDFKMEARVELLNKQGTTGMIEIYLLDDVNNIVGKVGLEDWFETTIQTRFKAKAGDAIDGEWIGSYTAEKLSAWDNFKGVIRLEREGLDWYAYAALVSDVDGKHSWQKGSKRNVHFFDKDGKYQNKISQIQISFRMFPLSTPCPMYVHGVKVWRKNTVQANEIPYIGLPGDLIEIDHQKNEIRLNGESRIDLKDFGATFFSLKKGENPVFFMPEGALELNAEWRERFL